MKYIYFNLRVLMPNSGFSQIYPLCTSLLFQLSEIVSEKDRETHSQIN